MGLLFGFFEEPPELAFRDFDPDEDGFFFSDEGERFFFAGAEDRFFPSEDEDAFVAEEGDRFFFVDEEEEDVFFAEEVFFVEEVFFEDDVFFEDEGDRFFVEEVPVPDEDDVRSPDVAAFPRRLGRSELVRRPSLASDAAPSPDRRVVRVRFFVPLPSLDDVELADRLEERFFFLLGLRFWVRASPDRAMIVSSVPR